MKKVNNFLSSHIGFIFVIIVSLLSVISLFHYGLPPTHDGEYHVVRFYEFDKTLRAGDWYPVWAPDLNYTYGSPLFDYVYPLPNYLASLFHLFGSSFIDAFKINLIAASISGAVFAYLYGSKRFGIWGGVLTSTFYTFAPYHFLDIYIRGSVGEVWALALFPLGLFTLDNVIRKRSTASILIAGVCYSLIIFSHNILAVMYTGFVLFYILLLVIHERKRIKALIRLLCALGIGLLLSSIFVIPALTEEKYVAGLKIFNPLEGFVEIYQLLIPSWGSGFSGGTLTNQMSFQIGIANLLVVALIISALVFRKIKKNKIFVIFFLVWFFILCFLTTSYAAFIWKNIAIMQNFQFPWRFLSLVILCCAVLAGSISQIFKSKILYVALILFCIISSYSYAKPPYFLKRSDSYYTTRENFIYGTNSIGNAFQTKWLTQQKNLPKSPVMLSGVKIISKNAVEQTYLVDLGKAKSVVFNTAYFPGWKAYIDGKNTSITDKSGKISVSIPKGSHTVVLKFEDTFVRFIAKSISILTFFAILCILGRYAVI